MFFFCRTLTERDANLFLDFDFKYKYKTERVRACVCVKVFCCVFLVKFVTLQTPEITISIINEENMISIFLYMHKTIKT